MQKTPESTVKTIIEMHHEGFPSALIRERTGIPESTINYIIRNFKKTSERVSRDHQKTT